MKHMYGANVRIRNDRSAASSIEFRGLYGTIVEPDDDEGFGYETHPDYVYIRLEKSVDGMHRWWVPTSDVILLKPSWEV